jgi:hypothetical protein
MFLIVSELPDHKVLDIARANAAAGTSVIIYKNKGGTNQKWYTNPQGQILSALNNMTFHASGKGEPLKTVMPSGDPRSQWRIEGHKIVNGAGECLDVRGAHDKDGTEVCAYDYKNKPNQHWLIQYC